MSGKLNNINGIVSQFSDQKQLGAAWRGKSQERMMVEFWMMLALATTNSTMTGTAALGEAPPQPVYYTHDLCMDAAKEAQQRTGTEYFCVKARPIVKIESYITTFPAGRQ